METIFDLLLKIPWWGWLIVAVVLVWILSLISAIVKPFGKILLFIVKGILFVISLPFRAIIAIFRAIFGRKSKNKNSEVNHDEEDKQKE